MSPAGWYKFELLGDAFRDKMFGEVGDGSGNGRFAGNDGGVELVAL